MPREPELAASEGGMPGWRRSGERSRHRVIAGQRQLLYPGEAAAAESVLSGMIAVGDRNAVDIRHPGGFVAASDPTAYSGPSVKLAPLHAASSALANVSLRVGQAIPPFPSVAGMDGTH
jgi:hypothetical protein